MEEQGKTKEVCLIPANEQEQLSFLGLSSPIFSFFRKNAESLKSSHRENGTGNHAGDPNLAQYMAPEQPLEQYGQTSSFDTSSYCPFNSSALNLSALEVDQKVLLGSGASSLVFEGVYRDQKVAVKMFKVTENDEKIMNEVLILR